MSNNLHLNQLYSERTQEQDIIERWKKDLSQNSHFANEPFYQQVDFVEQAKSFFASLVQVAAQKNIPSFSSEALSPLFAFWHTLLKDQIQKGFTTKDTAMLIFSLKNTLAGYWAEKADAHLIDNESWLVHLGTVLDFLGLLTFELYAAERERLILQQDEQIQYLQTSLRIGNIDSDLVARSPQMAGIYRAIGLVLENDVTVLIQGESGTGKEVIATLIHQNSTRKNSPLVTLNCGAIPKELVESELFGHEKGAFTGADKHRVGKFELAHGGTLFLDEIGELDLDLQVKLLRVLQFREIERVGGSQKIPIDVRIIAATNRNLQEAVADKSFRLDLFYRLNVFPIQVPPLRDRKDDILPLAMHFIKKYADQWKLGNKQLTKDAQQYLVSQPWIGNIRELENVIQRALILSPGSDITSLILQSKPGDFSFILDSQPKLISAATPAMEDTEIVPLEMLEKKAIEMAFIKTDGNVSKAAQALGISRTTFYNKARKYGLKIEEELS